MFEKNLKIKKVFEYIKKWAVLFLKLGMWVTRF